MVTHGASSSCPLVGQVVETLEREGKHMVKVALKSCCIEILLDPKTDAHLGDMVTMDAGIAVRTVEPKLMSVENCRDPQAPTTSETPS